MNGGRQWCAGVARQIVNDRIRASPGSAHADQPQHFVADCAHRGDLFYFLIAQARIMDDGRGHNLVRVAYQNSAGLAIAFQGQLDSILNTHEHDAANQ